MSSGSGITKARSVLAHDAHQPPILPGTIGSYPGMPTMPGTGMPPYYMPPPSNMMVPMNPMQQQQAMWQAQYYMQQQMQMIAFQQQAAAAAASAAGVPPQAPMMPHMMLGQWQPLPQQQEQQQQQQQQHPYTSQLLTNEPTINLPDPAIGEDAALFQDEVKGDLSDDVGVSEPAVGSSGSERDDGDEELNGAFGHVAQTEGV